MSKDSQQGPGPRQNASTKRRVEDQLVHWGGPVTSEALVGTCHPGLDWVCPEPELVLAREQKPLWSEHRVGNWPARVGAASRAQWQSRGPAAPSGMQEPAAPSPFLCSPG